MIVNTHQQIKPFISTQTWNIKKLIEIKNICKKDKFQRRMRWLYKRNNSSPKTASMREFINFLVKYRNSQIPIALGEFVSERQKKYSVSDGNNRIHAILNMLQKPYMLFDDFFEPLIIFSVSLNIDKDIKEKFIRFIKNLTYKEIRQLDWECKFEEIEPEIYKKFNDSINGTISKGLRNQFKKLKEKFSFEDNTFDLTSDVDIVVNVFNNFTYEQLKQNFLDVHEKVESMDEFDLLAASLGCYEITIENEELEIKLKKVIIDYYKNRNRNDELLEQYDVEKDKDFKWNAFDFLLSFQEYCCNKYKVFNNIDFNKPIKSVPLFFRLFKIMFNDNQLTKETFTQENVNMFIKKCEKGFKLLRTIVNDIYPNLNINNGVVVFKTREKSGKFKGMPLFALISILTGDNYIHTSENKNKIKQMIYYNSLIQQIQIPSEKINAKKHEQIKKKKDTFRISDILDSQRNEYKNTEHYLNEQHNNPTKFLSRSPTKTEMKNIIKFIMNHERSERELNPMECQPTNMKKRRQVTYTSFILMYDYWRRYQTFDVNQKIREEGIKMHNDHLIPHRSAFMSKLTLDRLGNLSPIMGNVNSGRGNDHIRYYWDNPETTAVISKLKIFPTIEEYDNIVEYIKSGSNKICKIKNTHAYNNLCERNETLYLNSFISNLYN